MTTGGPADPGLEPEPVDRASALPLWAQVHADLQRRLHAGAFEDTFPGELALVDGWTFRQWRARLDQHPDLKHETRGLSEAEIAARELNARLLGPTEAPIAKLQDKYRFHMLVTGTDLDGLRAAKEAGEAKATRRFKALHRGSVVINLAQIAAVAVALSIFVL